MSPTDPTQPPPGTPRPSYFKTLNPKTMIPVFTAGIIIVMLIQFLLIRYYSPDVSNSPNVKKLSNGSYPTTAMRGTALVPVVTRTGWKTYSHDEHKYTISYPPAWNLFPNAMGENTVITTAAKMDPNKAILVKSPDTAISIGVQSVTKDPAMTLREYNAKVVRKDPPTYADTELGGHPALRQSAGMAGDMEMVYYLVDGGSIVYEISINAVKTDHKIAAREILRTIQFTK